MIAMRGTISRKAQSGVVLLVTLVALVIVLVGAVALIRSADNSSVISGNLAFKRDLTNNAERAAVAAIAAFNSGALVATTTPYNSLLASNYSATILPTASTSRGIPDALLDDSKFATYGSAGNDIVDSAANVTIRYLVDRMCWNTGAPDPTICTVNSQGSDKGGTVGVQKANGGFQPVYRISVRVTGPRNTQAFVQTTLAN